MVNTYKLKLTYLQQEIIRILFINAGNPLNARRVSQLLGVTPPAVSKAMPLLEREQMAKVSRDPISKRLSIEMNRDSQRMIWLKRADNLKQIYECGLAQFLYDSFPGETVILFGSYAFGEDTYNSDLDLAVIGGKRKLPDVGGYSSALGRKIIINYYPSWTGVDRHLRNNILNGITMKGAVEL